MTEGHNITSEGKSERIRFGLFCIISFFRWERMMNYIIITDVRAIGLIGLRHFVQLSNFKIN